ncbi:MAG: NAD-glutamate dehydrogenase [Streptosporangiaceae bacterium]|nr:NAD-glutamate dehydrogenase [Streptosporangiaceae bacterium]
MPENADEARGTLLARAATAWAGGRGADGADGADAHGGPPGDAARAVGDIPGFLGAYYRHVAVEDLVPAGPGKVAAVAAWHAALGARRPQGRALVQVRDAHGAALSGAGIVVDIVTDDMPYLVDSVTMELNRHVADIELIVHPLLRARRDVTGVLYGTGAAGGELGSDALTESWIHVELARLGNRVSQQQLAADLRRILDDVRVAMEDQLRMRSAALDLVGVLHGDATHGGSGPAAAEAGELLAWVAAGHFTFLGYREYSATRDGTGVALRPIAGTGLGILRHDRDTTTDSFAALPPSAQEASTEQLSPLAGLRQSRDPTRLVLAKANTRSTVYRPNYLDYVAVERVGADGGVTGEYRFLGLYTQAAYTESITRIPVLRHKLAQVLAAAALPADSHDGKDLLEILEGYPREELFEISPEQLTPIALGVLRLRERKQVRLFLRPDAYGRYMSCLVYLPRDRYTTQIRLRAQEILREALHGVSVDYSAMVSNSALARLHVVVRGERGRPLPEVDAAALEREIAAAVRSWDEDLAAEAARRLGDERAAKLLDVCCTGIPETYKADVPAPAAVDDLGRILGLRESGEPFAVRLNQGPDEQWRLRVYRASSPITLSDVLPQLQHMGLEVVDEHPYEFTGTLAGGPFWIYDFGLRRGQDSAARRQAAERGGRGDAPRHALFEEALGALWQERTEDDGFSALVLDAGLTWREVVLLRAYARYLRQAGVRFSQDYLQRVLRSNASITRLLVRLFESRFDPARQAAETERSDAIAEEIRGALDEVVSLDHDRILRAYLALIEATLRTNYFQHASRGGGDGPAPYLVLKLDPGKVPSLPAPRPLFEIFVYSPRLEAVHLRFGRVARGGLRWSDRLEDFRTEVLGLVKAQEVKNSVIVPSGAKGGFVCKQLPDPASPSGREAYQAEVLACYRMFISAMLDITDNIAGDRVVPPPDVVRRDDDDPYLVVAADKGTATFSDAANEIAARYGFWLGDAFASGGSEGYDHKRMGITARGGWESVRWHFATLGRNVDTDDFTVAGIGDMSGDVFGNGMLLSRHIKLVAAFDHRHVFVDPDPDPAASFAERERLFAMARSSWADYDPKLISPGGGVWPRSVKSVPVSPQARAVLGIDAGVLALSPDELISAILAAPADLLWNGGIGTYVKASGQTHADAGDRSNDAVRIDAPRLRAKVVAEGGNLGLTQAARVEYALGGGLVNTDFIDNSAGVDTSDHEVNIKILLEDAIAAGEIRRADRAGLLQEMTDEVASLVLRHNYGQNLALATGRAQVPQMLQVHARYLRKLVRDKRLSREQDVLPGEKEIAERRSSGTGLTTPELALLLAHTKIAAGQDVLASGLPDDPYLQRALTEYFPAPLRARLPGRMSAHPLRREIISTTVVNEMVDTGGTTFLFRLNEETGASVPDITRAWLVAREVFGMNDFWREAENLAGLVDVGTQISLVLEGRKLMERACRWLLLNRRPPFDIRATVSFLDEGVRTVRTAIPKLLTGRDLAGFEERRDAFAGRGVPADLADQVAAMVPSYSAFDIVQSAAGARRGVEETAGVYFALADRLQISRLRDRIVALPREDRWSSMARSALRDDLYAAHAALTRDVLGVSVPGDPAGSAGSAGDAPGGGGERPAPEDRLALWADRNAAAVSRATQTLGEIWESERFTFTTMSVASRAIRSLAEASSLPQEAQAQPPG